MAHDKNSKSKLYAVKIVEKVRLKGRLKEFLKNEKRLLEEIKNQNVV